jgi:hypothetical protein
MDTKTLAYPALEMQVRFQARGALDRDESLCFRQFPHFTFDYRLDGRNIGFGRVRIDTAENELVWERCYPHASGLTVKRNGIGTLAHVETLLQTLQLYPVTSRYSVRDDISSEDRRLQFGKLGIEPLVATALPIYLQKSIDYARRKGFSFTMPELHT